MSAYNMLRPVDIVFPRLDFVIVVMMVMWLAVVMVIRYDHVACCHDGEWDNWDASYCQLYSL